MGNKYITKYRVNVMALLRYTVLKLNFCHYYNWNILDYVRNSRMMKFVEKPVKHGIALFEGFN